MKPHLLAPVILLTANCLALDLNANFGDMYGGSFQRSLNVEHPGTITATTYGPILSYGSTQPCAGDAFKLPNNLYAVVEGGYTPGASASLGCSSSSVKPVNLVNAGAHPTFRVRLEARGGQRPELGPFNYTLANISGIQELTDTGPFSLSLSGTAVEQCEVPDASIELPDTTVAESQGGSSPEVKFGFGPDCRNGTPYNLTFTGANGSAGDVFLSATSDSLGVILTSNGVVVRPGVPVAFAINAGNKMTARVSAIRGASGVSYSGLINVDLAYP